MNGEARYVPNEDHPQPECRCCWSKPFTTLVRVGRDVSPDGCLLLCDECSDFVVEVYDAMESVDSPTDFVMGFGDG